MDKEMERKLYDSASNGDLNALHDLLQQDPSLLKRVTLNRFNETPLHISVMHGHESFVKEVLKHNPHLAEEIDSCKTSPLHIASAKGYIEIVKVLLEVNADMCKARDREGRNPLHLSAIKGRVEVLKLLVKERPDAALEKINNGQTILHLCVKHDQFESLKLLLEALIDNEFVNSVDEEGNTVLHLAVCEKQIETVKYLLMSSNIDLNKQNTQGETALDMLARNQRDITNLGIVDSLREAGGLRGSDLGKSRNRNGSTTTDESRKTTAKDGNGTSSSSSDWLEKQRNALMVVATIIAQMAFQAGLNPPGGVWQETKKEGNVDHTAGQAVLATEHYDLYKAILIANTIAFVSSSCTILLLLSGFSLKRRFVMWILLVVMWSTITASGITYIWSATALTPGYGYDDLFTMTDGAIIAWLCVMGVVLIAHFIRIIVISIHKASNKIKGMNKWFLTNRHASSTSTNVLEP